MVSAHYANRSFDCPRCGRRHAVSVREVMLDPGAIEAIPGLAARLGLGPDLCVLHDTRTRAAAGESVVETLRRHGFRTAEVVVPDPPGGGDPVCDDGTRDALAPRIPQGAALVAVGAGVVNDLAKWISSGAGTPYVTIPTAASMNGYTSANIAPMVRGVKCLLPGHEPAAVVTSPAILCQAPAPLTAAGLGDVLAKPTSTADWMLARVLFGDYFCPFCADLVREVEPLYLSSPEAIGARTEPGIAALFDAILLTGFSMTMAGTSSPASGGEHLISHTLDTMALRDGARHDLHGRQVGVSAIFCAALYEETLRRGPGPLRPGTTSPDPAFWRRFARAVEEKHAVKRARQLQAAERLRREPRVWDELCSAVAPLYRPPALIKDVLRRAGAAHRIQDLGLSRERFLEAVLHAHEIRERYTILELARTAGVLPELAEELADRWLGP